MQDLRAVNEIIIPIHPLVPDPVPSSPECRGTPNISLFWTSEMHFSVFPYNQTLNIFLPLNEGTRGYPRHWDRDAAGVSRMALIFLKRR